MTATSNNISLFGQSTAQAQRLADLRLLMNDLSRQVTTGQVSDTYSGLGTNAEPLQNLNNQQPLLQSYQNNITTVNNRMTLMNNALQSISDVGNQLVTAIQTQLQNDPTDIASIRQIAQQGLSTVEDMINQQTNGQYLFAGSDATTPPFVDDSTLNSNFSTQIQNWLATGGTATLLNTTDGFSATGLGLSPNLAASGAMTMQIGVNETVDYTVKADQSGFQDIIRALTLVANTPYPGVTDVATASQFQTVMNHALTTAQQGVREIDSTAQSLAGKFSLVQSVQQQNDTDLGLVQNQIAKLEAADTTSAIAQMQILQTQLTASYQVTSLVNKLSLVNYL